METIIMDKELTVFYVTAKSFPDGIPEAFERLHSSIPHTKTRTLYGISRPESANGPIVYRAAAEVLEKDDPKKVNLETMIIKKGKYRCLTVNNYSKDPAIISRSFDDILKQPGLDPNGYCIEWYLTEKDVLCMVRLK